MLLRSYRDALTADASVDEERGQRPGIFVRDYAGDRPNGCRVLRWERDATLAESPAIIILKWSLTAERILHCIDWRQAVNRCFARENTGLNLVIVMREMSPHIQSTPIPIIDANP